MRPTRHKYLKFGIVFAPSHWCPDCSTEGQSSICGLSEAARLHHSSSSPSSRSSSSTERRKWSKTHWATLAPLLPRLHVRKAEVDPLVDAHVDHILGCIREAVIGARLLRGCSVRGGHREGHFVGPEEEGQGTGYGAGDVVGARGVVGIVLGVLIIGCQFGSPAVSGLPSLSPS